MWGDVGVFLGKEPSFWRKKVPSPDPFLQESRFDEFHPQEGGGGRGVGFPPPLQFF